mgnify:CR=1 FL=1
MKIKSKGINLLSIIYLNDGIFFLFHKKNLLKLLHG